MASEHGILVSPVGPGVWGGRFSIVTVGASGVAESATITDANFNSAIIRSTSNIILTAANITASGLYRTATAFSLGPWIQGTNNASLILSYASRGAGQTATFYFLVFNGGTNT